MDHKEQFVGEETCLQLIPDQSSCCDLLEALHSELSSSPCKAARGTCTLNDSSGPTDPSSYPTCLKGCQIKRLVQIILR